jgi:hypothetical protein
MSSRIQHLIAAVILATAGIAHADMSKEQCLDAHSKGQDARDAGKLSLARKVFLTCAQASCPALVQGDCARFADDLGRQQPTLTFVARDGSGADLPDTTVYIDDALVVTRLDDGKPHDADPGKHVVRFVNAGHEQQVTIILNAGEKGRNVVATFASPSVVNSDVATPAAKRAPAKTTHPTGAKIALVAGAVAFVGGGALGTIEVLRIPSSCALGTHMCLGTPGDPSYSKAASAVKWMDVGFGAAGVGAAALIGGAIWYFKGASHERESLAIIPSVSPDSIGVSLSGRM